MHRIEELKEKLLEELADYAENGKFSEDDAKNIKNLSGAIDHICNILMAYEEEEGEYSGRYDGGMSYQRGGQGGNRGGGSRGGNQGGGSYARGRTGNVRRDSRGRYSNEGGYSRADEVENMVESIRGMMGDLPREIQRDAQRFVQKLEQHMM